MLIQFDGIFNRLVKINHDETLNLKKTVKHTQKIRQMSRKSTVVMKTHLRFYPQKIWKKKHWKWCAEKVKDEILTTLK